jgi:hypothetical protein
MQSPKKSSSIPRTDLSALSEEVCRRHYRAAFPNDLPDRWLQPLARDLRMIERLMAGNSHLNPRMEGPLLVALHLLQGRLAERGMDTSISFTVEGFARWLQVFQFVLEREMVTRIIGIKTGDDDNVLLAALDREIDEAVGPNRRGTSSLN